MGLGILIGNGSSTANTPFLVKTRKNSQSGLWEAYVNFGDLLNSLQPDDNTTITGLETWIPLDANDVLWIEITISNYSIIGATLHSYGLGDSEFDPTAAPWDNGGFVQDDNGTPPKQISASCIIAQSEPDTNGSPSVTQKLFSNLLLMACCLDGFPAIFPFPSPYGRYITS